MMAYDDAYMRHSASIIHFVLPSISRWRHILKTIIPHHWPFARGIHRATGSPTNVMRSFAIYIVINLNKLMNKTVELAVI